MEFQSQVKHKPLCGQSRELIYSMFKFMERESSGLHVLPLNQVRARVSTATGVSIGTIARIVNEGKDIEDGKQNSFHSPNKRKRNVQRMKTDLDVFDRSLLRRIIQNYNILEKKVPTLQNILEKFSAENGYRGSRESLRQVIHKLGFRWRKTKTNKKLLMERTSIRNLRSHYLQSIANYRVENRSIIYVGLHKLVSKGQRQIIISAGGENGFISQAYTRWISSKINGEYQSEMSFDLYKQWLEERLLPNLPPKTVLVIGNAPYHKKEIHQSPTPLSRKDVIVTWLRQKHISFDDNMKKMDLYNLVKLYKPKHREYVIDKILNEAGHDVLRLPPYHSDLNPIELIWSSMKESIAAKTVSFPPKDGEQLTDEFFCQFTIEDWKSRCDHVKLLENEFMTREPLFDDINVGGNADDDDSETDCSYFSESEENSTDEDVSVSFVTGK